MSFPSTGGTRLVGRLFSADGDPRVAVVVHAATGVPQGYYAAFAQWLCAAHGAAVLTYDYRDFGASGTGSLRGSRATMAEWGRDDQSAALDLVCERFPGLPVWVIGHSLGALCLPFHAQAERVSRLVAVASGPAYWRRHPLAYMPAVLAFWWLVGPLATLLLGYLPGRLIGLGADLPRGVYWQWRRWCLSPRFHRVDWGGPLPVPDLDRVRCDVTLVAVADDRMIPPPVVRALAAFYPAARVSHRTIAPADIGARAIGHLRLFSRANARAWPLMLAGPAP